MKKSTRLSALLLAVLLTLSLAACVKGGESQNPGGSQNPSENASQSPDESQRPSGEPIVIRWGHNWSREMDTNFRDPITGEAGFGQEEMNARLYAEQQVLEKYNVKIQFVDYPTDATEDILQSVLANDPLAELVRVVNGQQGALLAQNVLQPLDEYESLFADEDSSWIFWGKVYGHNYFMNNVMRVGASELLSYNIGMLDRVEALKVNGVTKYPADIFAEGNWTWSEFESYLQKVSDHFKPEADSYQAWQADYRSAAVHAIYSNGGEIYGDSGLGVASEQTKQAVAFIDRLIQKGLMFSENQINGDAEVVGLMDTWRFQWGQSAFCSLPQWLARDMAGQFAERGDAMGMVPFPRPDNLSIDDPAYRQINDATDCYSVPRGVSKEMTELAVKVFKEYTQSYYMKTANSDKAMDYFSEESVKNVAAKLTYDVTNPVYGKNIINSFMYLVNEKNAHVNDYSKNAGVFSFWSHDILGYSFYGIENASKYDVQVEAKKGQLDEIINNYQTVLSGTAIIDTIAPKIMQAENTRFAFPEGTDPAAVDWSSYITAEDNVDGALDTSKAVVNYARVDFSGIGMYANRLTYTIQDSNGNEGTLKVSPVIYDGASTTPPVLVIKAEYRTVQLDEDTSAINWKDDFVESAKDKDGLDLKAFITADLSELDTTTAGEYEVVLTLTDYCGNTAQQAITVTVSK